MKHTVTFCIAVFLLYANVSGQMNVVDIEKQDTLFSQILNEKRPLRIYIPEGYEKDSVKYPVVYLLDGEWRFVHAVATVRFLTAEGFMPKAIVIALPNVSRERDLLPDKGGNSYLQFITKELFSYVEKQYRADTFRILIGHSFGGVFAMHTLATQPQAFSGYIMIDPALWYNKEQVIKEADQALKNKESFPKIVYISGNEGSAWQRMSIDAADSLFKAAAPKDMLWKTCAYANETHVSVAFKSIYDGLRLIFNDYRRTAGTLFPDKGMFVEGKPYMVFLNSELNNLYYTNDGTKPSKASNKLAVDPATHFGIIPVNKASKITISTASSYQGAGIVTGIYEEDTPMEPVKKPGKLNPGVTYRAYEGNWDKLPDFSQLKPVSEGVLKNFVIPESTKKDGFGIQFESFIYAAEEGYYDIGLSSNDGARLFINNKLIIDTDGLHNSDDLVAYRLYLKAGYHSVKLDYFNKGNDAALTLEFIRYPWTIKDVDLKIPDDLLFYRDK